MKTYLLLFLLLPFWTSAQLKLKPVEPKEIQEGQKVSFQASFEHKNDSLALQWTLSGDTTPSMNISSKGVFSWTPDYNVVSQQEIQKSVSCYIKAAARLDSLFLQDSTLVTIMVKNANSPPILPKTPEILWIAKANAEVTKTFTKEFYRDDEGDAFAFRLENDKYSNLKLSPEGVLTVSLNTKELRKLPDTLFFELAELNTKEKFVAKQMLIIRKAAVDEPPVLSISPDSPKFQLEEGDALHLEIQITDENDDIKNFDFFAIPQSKFAPKDFLEKQANGNYTFHWVPPLDFVAEEQPNRLFQLVLTVQDEAKLTTTKQIEVEILNKINWQVEDNEREKTYNQLLTNAAVVYLRLEKSFQAADKDIKKMLKNKKLKSFANNSLKILSQNINMIKNEDTKSKLSEYSTLAKDAIETNNNNITMAAEYPAEFSQIQRITNIVSGLKETFVDTEQFIEIYKYTANRRKPEFLTHKAELLKKISSVSKDSSLQLENIKPETIDIKSIFTNY